MAQAEHPGEPSHGKALRTPHDAASLLSQLLRDRVVECVVAVHLDAQFHVIRMDLLAEGDESAAALPVPGLLRDVLCSGATRVILAHNHPGGDPAPSVLDRYATRRLAVAAAALNIDLLDHIVIARDAIFSFRSEGLL